MSRGPGAVERAIETAFTANPSRTFTVEDLAGVAYPGVNRVEKKHRVAVIRAADKVTARRGWLGFRASRPGHPVIYSNPMDVRSYAIGRMRRDFSDGEMAVAEIEHCLDDPDVHGSVWHRVQPGGAWWLHVEMHKADIEGRTADVESLRADLDAVVAAKRRER